MQRIGFASGSFRIGSNTHARAAAAIAIALASFGHPEPATAVATSVVMCGVKAATSYDIIYNGVPTGTGASTALGLLAFAADVSSGTLVSVAPIGDLAPPTPPVFTSLATGPPGCATAAWLQSSDPTVIGYVVAYGRRSVAGGEAGSYNGFVEVGPTGSVDVCFLPVGTHYFAVRAKNVAGMLSGYSAERSVDIVVVSVLITRFDARAAADGVHLSWRVAADEIVRGYRVYRVAADEPQRSLTDDMLAGDATSYLDASARPGIAYTYLLAAVKEDGGEVYSIPVVVAVPALAFDLEPNVPNPFNPSTRIAFTLPEGGRAVVRVYDVRGAHVATVLDARLDAGRHHVDWKGVGDDGTPVASGTYFYSLAAGKRSASRKMLLLK